MVEQEGVIKYHLDHRQKQLPDGTDHVELNAWRTILYRLNLIGQIPERYDGLGFGNISRRLVPGQNQFLITGTQTGNIARLGLQHYALIETASPQQNSIHSTGLCQPSSEALTHAGVYQQEADAHAVIHVHSPELWRNTHNLKLPHTAADIPYGTTMMAEAVAELFISGQLKELPIFTMLGHEDGVVAIGESLTAAATLLISQLAKAIAIEQQCMSD